MSKDIGHFVERLAPIYRRQAACAAQIDIEMDGLVRELRLSPVKTYVVRGEGTRLVKIGKSQYVKGRVRSLQSGSPTQLKLIRQIPFDCEHRMHVRFAHLRKHGEWFEFDIEMLTETFHEDILGLAKAHLERAA